MIQYNPNNLRNDIIKIIQKIVYEIQLANKLYILGKELNSNNISENRYKKFMIESQKIIEEKTAILNQLIRIILESEYLRKLLKIRGKVSPKEIEIIVNDIDGSLNFLEFREMKDVSNYIFAYINKFLIS